MRKSGQYKGIWCVALQNWQNTIRICMNSQTMNDDISMVWSDQSAVLRLVYTSDGSDGSGVGIGRKL